MCNIYMFYFIGKKGKTKWKAVNLTDIVEPNVPRKPAATLWADEADEPDCKYSIEYFLPKLYISNLGNIELGKNVGR